MALRAAASPAPYNGAMSSHPSPLIITADFVLPMAAPGIVKGAIAWEHNRIMAMGPADDVLPRYSGAIVRHYPHHVILPALVNTHTHLELSYLTNRIAPPGDFGQWAAACMRAAPPPEQLISIVSKSAQWGATMCQTSGVLAVGDVSRHYTVTRPILERAGLQGVGFAEVMAIGGRRSSLREQLQRLCAPADADLINIKSGVSPHAPYTVEGPALRDTVEMARARHMPICMHVAELAEESEFLANISGMLAGPWRPDHALLDAAIPRGAHGPIQWAKQFGLLDAGVPVVLAHVNYATDADLDLLAAAPDVSVAYCPRTRSYFGHDDHSRHRWRDMLARGINVAIGTDSVASNPDLSVLRELRHIMKLFPESDPQLLLKMATVNGARALGLPSFAGTLQIGGPAEMAVFALPERPFRSVASACRALIRRAPPPDTVYLTRPVTPSAH